MMLRAANHPGGEVGQIDVEARLDFLHPFFVARIGGEPAMLVAELGSSETAEILRDTEAASAALDERKIALCARLEQSFREVSDRRLGQRLIQLKRDIYNCRSVPVQDDLLEIIPGDMRTAVIAFLDDARCLAESKARLPTSYANEVGSKRESLRAVWRRDNLRAGILCSNRFLYAQLTKFMSTDGPLPDSKKVAQACDSLLSYASRASLKASPLSSFTLVWVGEWVDRGQSPTQVKVDSLPIRRLVEVKHSAVLHAFEPIWSSLEALGDNFPLILNPSVRQEDGKLEWTQPYRSGYRHPKVWGHNGTEITIAANPSVRLLFRIFHTLGQESLTAASIIGQLSEVEPNFDKRHLFLAKMLDLQLLLPAWERYEQEPFLPWLIDLVGRMAPQRAVPLVGLLKPLAAAVDQFRSVEESGREDALRMVDQLLHSLAEQTGANLPAKMLSPPLYEDCFVAGDLLQLNACDMLDVRADLARLLELVPALDFNQVMQSLFAQRFIERYGEAGTCHEPYDFLHEVMKTYFGPESEIDFARMEKLHRDQMEIEIGRQIHDIRKRYLEYFSTAENRSGTIEIDPAFLGELTAAIPDAAKSRPLSQCFTGQFATLEDGSETFVLNQILPGGSGLMSRFFNELHSSELDRLKAYMRRLAPSGDYAEVSAVFGFNANLHPMLADDEIAIPGFPSGRRKTRKRDLLDFTITYSSETDRLIFRDGGRPIDMFYFGFMAPALLPRRLRPLMISSTQNKIFFISRELERARKTTDSEVTVLPRIMFGKVCLARRAHVFPRRLQPDFNSSDFAFFEAVWRWRRDWGLPQHAFWRLLPEFPDDGAAGQLRSPRANMMETLKGQQEFDMTALKPSYIDFDDPLYVRAFKRALARNDFDLAVEEALPAPNMHTLRVGQARHLCEYQFEISRSGRPSE